MTPHPLPAPRTRKEKTIVLLLLVAVLALGAFLRFHDLGESGVGNNYYAAAVESMLQSWHNFFFVSFEPGGSVSLDKPPLGFWVQCLSAYFLGVSGFALALPNALAGVLSIFVLYHLIRRPFGAWAGLLAALALALTPVAISAERNNTIDGLLVFVLLLAAWAFVRSVNTGRVRWLLLGACLVGLGFNIKMLQAFLPLPGLYALYFFSAKHKWGQRLLHLGLATLLLLVVSFSWAVAVDLTPPENRPYVGGSEDNTVMELIFGHNGLARLIGGGLKHVRADNPVKPPGGVLPTPQPEVLPAYPGGGQQPADRQAGSQNGSGNIMDVGTPGSGRLFTFPLGGEIGWILPFVLGSLGIIVLALWKRPCGEEQAALILWAGWMVPEALYFTYSSGIMHAYYMIMLGAPLAALFAIGGWASWKLLKERRKLAMIALVLVSAGTLTFQAFLLNDRAAAAPWATGGALVLLNAGLLAIASSRAGGKAATTGLSLVLLAMLVIPGLWSALTTFNPTPQGSLPYAGPARQDDRQRQQPPRKTNILPEEGILVNPQLLDYLLENRDGEKYLLATLNAGQAAPFILSTGLPVFTFGGFAGMDILVDVEGLAEMVAAGELRFVLNEGLENRQWMLPWLRQNCAPVVLPGVTRGQAGEPDAQVVLLDCGK